LGIRRENCDTHEIVIHPLVLKNLSNVNLCLQGYQKKWTDREVKERLTPITMEENLRKEEAEIQYFINGSLCETHVNTQGSSTGSTSGPSSPSTSISYELGSRG
jgi:hypothetical protein